MLKVGHHITYLPKDKGTLYVGYTRYPNIPKTQEGYIRQGKDVEDDFILFKQGLLKPKPRGQKKPPEVLYFAVEEKYIQILLAKGMHAEKNESIGLYMTKEKALKSKNNKENIKCIEVKASKMLKEGYKFIQDIEDVWYTDYLPNQYLSI